MRTYTFVGAMLMAPVVLAGVPSRNGMGLFARDKDSCQFNGMETCPGGDPGHCYHPDNGEVCCRAITCQGAAPASERCNITPDNRATCCSPDDHGPDCQLTSASSTATTAAATTTSTASSITQAASTTTTPAPAYSSSSLIETYVTETDTITQCSKCSASHTSSETCTASPTSAPLVLPTLIPMLGCNSTAPVDNNCEAVEDTLKLISDLLAKYGHHGCGGKGDNHHHHDNGYKA